MHKNEYDKQLEAFVCLLKNPRTARELAAIAGISKPTVYARLAELKKRGVPIERRRQKRAERPAGWTGPRAFVYKVAETFFRRRERGGRRGCCLATLISP